MATSKPKTGLAIRIPDTLTLKDLITIVSVAISLTIAWGVFSTRIALLEKEVVSMQTSVARLGASSETINRQIRRLESRQQDDEMILDQVFLHLNKPAPRRRANPD